MIVTVTFNPALDVSGDVDKIVPDEKSYVENESYSPGGNGINAGIIASRLGSEVSLSGFLGGANGEVIKKLLRAESLKLAFEPIEASTRMNVTVSNRSTHKQTRLSFPGPTILPEEKELLRNRLAKLKTQDLVILGGSLPKKFRISEVKKMISDLQKKGIPYVIDMPGEHLKHLAHTSPLFIKPNLTEFQEMTGTKASTIKAVLKSARTLTSKMRFICVSSVEGGALLIGREECWFGKIPEVEIRSTVGAGDSMVGAMAHLLHQKKNHSPQEILRLGLAASCATLTEKGVMLGKLRAIKKFHPLIEIERVD